MKQSNSSRLGRTVLFALVALALAASAGIASAEVRREGSWPASDKRVSLSLKDQPRAEAIKQLAEKAGWGVVVELPAGAPLDLQVRDQDAAKVLELLLTDGQYVAKRDGSLIAISLDHAGAASPAAAPSAAPAGPVEPATSAAPASPSATGEPVGPAPTSSAATATPPAAASAAAPTPADDTSEPEDRGEDRSVMGGETTIGRDETVHDLSVMGGSAEVLGRVTGDVSVTGGEAAVRSGARVRGDVSVLGGELTIEDGARVDGDVSVLGGELHRGPKARIGGEVSGRGGEIDGVGGKAVHSGKHGSSFATLARDTGGSLTRLALLFVFGAVLFGLATRRMEQLQTEVAARPMRSFGWGVLGSLLGLLVLVVLCVTIIGIPVAVVAVLAAVFAVYAGICGVLAAVGAALVRHKSKSPYVHLAVGCLVYLLLGWLPWIGGWVTAALVLTGIGVIVVTRAAGLVPKKRGRAEGNGPYRTTPAAA